MNGTAVAPAGVPQLPQPPPAAPVAVNGSAAPAPVNRAPSEAPHPATQASVVDKPADEESKKGRFGWFDIEKVKLLENIDFAKFLLPISICPF